MCSEGNLSFNTLNRNDQFYFIMDTEHTQVFLVIYFKDIYYKKWSSEDVDIIRVFVLKLHYMSKWVSATTNSTLYICYWVRLNNNHTAIAISTLLLTCLKCQCTFLWTRLAEKHNSESLLRINHAIFGTVWRMCKTHPINIFTLQKQVYIDSHANQSIELFLIH